MIKKIASLVLMISVVSINFSFLAPSIADAAALTAVSDTVSNLTASTVANHTIKFTTPSGVAATTGTIILTFDASQVMGSVAFGDMDLQDDGVDVVLAASPSGATWGAVKAGQVITFTNGNVAVAPASVITIKIGTNATGGVNQMTNGVAGNTVLRISGSMGDVGALSLPIVTNSIVSVTAEVLSTISFTISQNAIYFGNLRTGGPCFAQNTNPGYVTCPTITEAEAFNMTASTNGTGGYAISVQGPTLTSGANTITAIPASAASNPGNEQFGLTIVKTGVGSGTATAPYSTASQYAYTGTSSTAAQVASASAPSDVNTYSVRYIANISPITEAGTYTAAHTYIATGNF